MEDDEDDPIAVMQLRTWPEIPQDEFQQLRDAALSPSFQRLLLVMDFSPPLMLCFRKDFSSMRLRLPLGPPGSFAWACQSDCYTAGSHGSGPFEELLFTCGGDGGLVIYGFPSEVSVVDYTSISSSNLEVELGYHDVDKPKLVFLEAEAWPAFVSFTIPRGSTSFSRLIKFATSVEEQPDGSYEFARLVSSPRGNLVAMLVREASSGSRVVVVAKVTEWDVRWIARILLDVHIQDWVDFALVLDKFLALTAKGKVFVWDASTGTFLSTIDVPVDKATPTATTFSRLHLVKSRSLVGVTDVCDRIFLVSLDTYLSQPGIRSSSWELANADAWSSKPGLVVQTPGASAFTPKHLLTMRRPSPDGVRKLRDVVLPCVPPSSATATAISSCSVTRFVRRNGLITVTQTPLHCSSDANAWTKVRTSSTESVGFSFQGSVYLVSATSLAVVLPPLVETSRNPAIDQWWSTSPRKLPSNLICEAPFPQLRRWQMAVLDRCLIYDGLDEAEHLFAENGWSVRLARLRKLQLALDYQRSSEIVSLLNKLIPVGAAELGVLRLIFTAVELISNKFGSDNEISQAARLLALGARFTRELIKLYGLTSLPGDNRQKSHHLLDLARFLETIRTVQGHLHSRKARPSTEKDEVASEAVDKVEKRAQSIEPDYSEESLVPSVISSAEDGGNSRRHPSQETPKEMIARWDRESVDVVNIVKDALRAGRIPLAVVQLHHRKAVATGTNQQETDVFKEVRDIGRSIVYELLCKGKIPIALAALRRLGEDIPSVLHDLAFCTVRRSLRAHTTKELRRHDHLNSQDYRLLQTISRIESVYPSNSFWKSYHIRHRNLFGSATPSDLKLQIGTEDFYIESGEIDDVVLEGWNGVGAEEVEEESSNEVHCAAYWAGALVWLQTLDELTIDRMLLEQCQALNAAWSSQLKYAVVHHIWSSASSLLTSIPSSELQGSELQVYLTDTKVIKITKVQFLAGHLSSSSSWFLYLIERDLASRYIFLRSTWAGATELLSLLSHAGLIFTPLHVGLQQAETVQGVCQLIVRYCVHYQLPWLLELYLDHHSFDKDVNTLLSLAQDCPWAKWLLLSRGHQYSFEYSFANAMAIIPADEPRGLSTLDDMAKSGKELMALSTLVYAPILPQKCVYSGVKKQSGKSWQCSLEHLQAGLKPFPTLWNSLKLWCFGRTIKLNSDLPSYLQWRLSQLSSADYGTSLLALLPKWLPRTFRKVLYFSIEGSAVNEGFMNPASWEDAIRRKIQTQIHLTALETPKTKVEHHLLQGRPLAAFYHVMSLREEQEKSSIDGVLLDAEKDLLSMVVPLGIRNFKNTVVTAACCLLLELCGLPGTMLRTDVAALRRISESKQAGKENISEFLARTLSESYMESDVAGQPDELCTSLILKHLERASLATKDANGLWLKTGEGDGQQLRFAQMAMSERWSLVTAFCRVHHLPLSTAYLSHLAEDNDWVGFLSEAQSEGCPQDVLNAVASEHFTDTELRSHVLTVLKSMSAKSEGTQDYKNDELFSLIAEIESHKTPGADLIQKTKSMRWPLLAVVASCFNDASPLACMTAWLDVTAEREINGIGAELAARVGNAVDALNAGENLQHRLPVYIRINAKRRRLTASQDDEFNESTQPSQSSKSLQVGDGHQESLVKMVASLCERQHFIPLLRALELFLPSSPLLHFIRFLRAFSQMRLSEASAHLADFSAFLKEEIHSKGGRPGATWITKAAIAGADAILVACPSAYEKRCMLQLLAAAEFGDGGAAAMGYRKLYWKLQLSDPSLRQGRPSTTQVDDLDDDALLRSLETSGQWEDARSWARQLDLGNSGNAGAVHHVTEMQAEAMVIEWKELLWDVPEQRAALWRHCQALFTKHSYPPLKAGMFFLKHAEDIEQHGLPAELHAVLLLALQWLSGSITGSPPVYPVPLLRELETRVWLLAVESEVLMKGSSSGSSSFRFGSLTVENPYSMHSGSPVDRTAAKIATVDGHLKVFSYMHVDDSNSFRQVHGSLRSVTTSDGGSRPKRRLLRRIPEPDVDFKSKVPDEDSSTGWEEKVGEGEVERAILALVEVGQVSAARQLQHKLSPARVPAELVWAETAYSVAMLSSPTVKGSLRGSALGAPVMKTLNKLKLKDVSSATPLQAMEALTAACREGCGRGHCRRVTAVAQIANFLDLPFFEAFQKHPTELLQLLSLKGQDALSEAKLLVSTHSINAASIARILAESFLKGLLAAHRGGYIDSSSKEEGPAPLLWRSSDFIQWGQLCPSEPELGHALMRLVISGHDMPHACEVELLILAHQFYESSACLDGMDVLVALAATRVESYVAEGDFPALARLVTGVSNFQALRFVLDLLIENGQLELLLKKRAAVDALKESSASVRGFRMAVLSALKHFNPHDLDAFGMVFSHFSMAHEMANLLESRGRKGLSQWSIRNDPEQNEEMLEIMRFFVEASEVYAGIDCGNKTRWCCAQASLLSLQLRMPELLWLNQTETNARRLLVDQRRFQEALVVAEAYGLNQPAEWVPVLWNQVLSPGWIEHFLTEFVASLPLRPSMLMELARIYRSEVLARGDHLDFSKWLTSGMPPEITKSFRCILKHVGDFRLRTQLTTLASGFPDVLDTCARILDKVPDTAGPLVLKRGHGGTYVPLM